MLSDGRIQPMIRPVGADASGVRVRELGGMIRPTGVRQLIAMKRLRRSRSRRLGFS
jgi:hypothetical protein